LSALVAPLLANWYLIPPFHTFRINDGENILELVVFVSAATIVSAFVAVAARRATEADSAWREATTLAALSQAHAADPVDGILSLLVDTFQLTGVSVIDTKSDTNRVLACTGDQAPINLHAADFTSEISNGITLAVNGSSLTANDHRILAAFVGQLARALKERELRSIATEAEALSKADELRTAILRAVSHDLRSPLASIKASVSSLRQPDIDWPQDVREDFLFAIEDDTDRLTDIITNLLDLSRIEAGVLRPVMRALSLDEILPSALRSIDEPTRITLAVDDSLPDFIADPALLDRVMANVLGNAVAWSPVDQNVTMQAFSRDQSIHIHVVDHGVGIPESERAKVLQPFHRLGDSSHTGGLGLGLAIADRLIAAMNGRLELRDTPGGGLTVAIVLSCAEGTP
jgi:two-component system sensor histidine kinase KdpD